MDGGVRRGMDGSTNAGMHGNTLSSSTSSGAQGSLRNGALLLSCHTHCMALASSAWHGPGAPHVAGKTMAEAVGNWYFDREDTNLVDCPFPCNPTCPRAM
ncbi:hypothetical protein CLOM_g10803 [Closterium sp. NIES-68]|nr:hypothetical protein CLOM_g10803 [Closterium sp. NIES-68]